MSLISCEDPASSEGDFTQLAQSHTVPIHPFNQARWFVIVDFILASVLLLRVPTRPGSSLAWGLC